MPPSQRPVVRATVPWEEVLRRVEAAGRAIEQNVSRSPTETQSLLEERARLLARPVDASAAGDDVLNLITFMLRNEGYAVESRFVLEVFRPVEVAPLPAAERPIYGVTAWRGELLPVIDLRALLDFASAPPSDRSMLLVLGYERPVLAIPADVMGMMRAVAVDAIRPPVGFATSEYVRGVTPQAALVLNVDKILQVAGPEPV